MTRGHLLSIYTNFSDKKRTYKLLYISWQNGHHYYIQILHNDLFSHYNLFLGKLAVKARVNTDAIILDCAYAPWSSHNTR